MRLLSFALMMMLGLGLTQAQANVQAPDALVKETADKIVKRLQADRELYKQRPERVQPLVDELVLPSFDFERMSSWVLGKHWRTATADQKNRFTREFRSLLVRTYAKALVDNMDRKINYSPVRMAPGSKDVTVRTEVQQDGGFPIPIDYSLYLADKGWKVYDVNIDGVSLVANYRTSFASELRKGGNIEDLIKRLQDRNSKPIGNEGGKK